MNSKETEIILLIFRFFSYHHRKYSGIFDGNVLKRNCLAHTLCVQERSLPGNHLDAAVKLFYLFSSEECSYFHVEVRNLLA